MGSTWCYRRAPSFIVHILSVHARVARRRWEESMKLPRRTFLYLTAGAAALPAVPRIARAQAYPTRPVRIIVGFPPAGGADIVARLIGQWLSERLGQQFIVENRPGAGSNIGTEAVVRAPPDGYTLLQVTSPNAINATLYDKLSFNFTRDIAPVAGLTRDPNVMEVNPSVPVKTVPEFIAYAKANLGKINMASAGNGTGGHVAGELFKMMIRPGRPIRIDREVIKDPFAAQGNFDHRALPTLIASLQKQKRFKVIIEGRRQGFSRAGSAATHGARPTGSSEGPLEHGSSFGEFAGQYAASRNEQITEGVPSYRITFNDRLNPTERFITIAHELGHIFLGPLENVPRERAMTTRVAGLIEDGLARTKRRLKLRGAAIFVLLV